MKFKNFLLHNKVLIISTSFFFPPPFWFPLKRLRSPSWIHVFMKYEPKWTGKGTEDKLHFLLFTLWVTLLFFKPWKDSCVLIFMWVWKPIFYYSLQGARTKLIALNFTEVACSLWTPRERAPYLFFFLSSFLKTQYKQTPASPTPQSPHVQLTRERLTAMGMLEYFAKSWRNKDLFSPSANQHRQGWEFLAAAFQTYYVHKMIYCPVVHKWANSHT